jgi:1-acyl-sn-glycerol-3-phosphate acyltransferase
VIRSALRDATDWLRRWDALVPRRDQAQLVCPPILVARFVRYALRRAGDLAVDDPGLRDPEYVGLFLDLIRVVARYYFRLEVSGVELVPREGPVLLVGCHNGGLVPMDSLFTILAIWDHFGPSRAVTMLAHDFLIDDELFRRYATRLGAVRAGHEGARRALRRGNAVLVYPGGDVDVFRPYRDRARVDLAGRKGFVELALREGVPIVPVVSRGTHEQFRVLARGDAFARLIRLHRWARAEVFPIVLSMPWGLTSGFVPYLPLPSPTTVAFGEPLAWPERDAEAARDPAFVRRCYEQVQGRMQALMDRLYDDHGSRGGGEVVLDAAPELTPPQRRARGRTERASEPCSSSPHGIAAAYPPDAFVTTAPAHGSPANKE